MTLPWASVRETTVLLKVDWMCAWPTVTFFFSRRRVRTTFFFGTTSSPPPSCAHQPSSAVRGGCGHWSGGVAQAAVGADLHEPLDVERDFPAELAFNLGFFVDHVAQPADLLIAKILDPQIWIDVRDRQDAAGGAGPDAEEVGQTDLDALVTRDVNAGDSSHLPS